MNANHTDHNIPSAPRRHVAGKRVLAAAPLSSGFAVAGFGLAFGTAQAMPWES